MPYYACEPTLYCNCCLLIYMYPITHIRMLASKIRMELRMTKELQMYTGSDTMIHNFVSSSSSITADATHLLHVTNASKHLQNHLTAPKKPKTIINAPYFYITIPEFSYRDKSRKWERGVHQGVWGTEVPMAMSQ